MFDSSEKRKQEPFTSTFKRALTSRINCKEWRHKEEKGKEAEESENEISLIDKFTEPSKWYKLLGKIIH